MKKATFGAGCFWGVELAFRQVEGVSDVAVGYLGGDFPNPTYRDVCTGRTGHAEVVEVDYDPEPRSRSAELLEVFFTIHDPTTPNRQGPDIGTQYRSAIFTHNADQQAEALASRAAIAAENASGRFRRSDRHRGRSGLDVLPGRGISPAIPRKARPSRMFDPLRPDALLDLPPRSTRSWVMMDALALDSIRTGESMLNSTASQGP